MSKGLTPSQTIGPFYWGTIVNAYRADLAPPRRAASASRSRSACTTSQGAIVPDGLFEIWQANSHGRYNHPDDRRNLPLDAGFEGFGRASTDTTGVAHFTTVKPGRVPWPTRAACRRRTSTSRSSPAASSTGWRRGSISTAIRPCRGSGAEDGRAGAARHADRQARRQGRVAPADPSRRPEETVFFDV